jgi:TonB family protein
MSSNDSALPGPPPEPGRQSPDGPTGAWLGSQSVFDARDERKLGRAMSASLALHGGLLAILIFGLAVAPTQLLSVAPDLDVVFLVEAGPGGGGGGSPAPAPAKKLEIPKHQPPAPPVPVPQPTVVPPPPVLIAPIETNSATVLQAAGSSSISLADLGGGGRGGGIGTGAGAGVGPGTDKGFGGGAYGPGAGISNPTLKREQKPKYTSEAMRAKIQGIAEVEAVVREDGTVGEVRIHKSLDKVFGLDLEALAAAKLFLFQPAIANGKPVPFKVIIQLEFRLH